MVDCELLISLIFEKTTLWDTRNKNYHNRDIARKLWNEIALEMKTTSDAVKNKWQNLRDTYRKEYMKSLLPTGSGSQGFISKWKYFDLLTFLNDSLAPRRVVSNVSNEKENLNSKSSIEVHKELNNECNSDLPFDDDLQSPDGSETTSKSDKTPNEKDENTAKTHCKSQNRLTQWIRSEKDPISDLIAIEKQKIAHLDVMASHYQPNTEIQDEDYFFVMSLLPHLRSIPKDHKLQTRIKIQQLIMEEKQLCDFNQSAFSPVPTPSPLTQDHTNDSLLSTSDGQNNPQQNKYRELRPPTTSTQHFSGLLGEFLCFNAENN